MQYHCRIDFGPKVAFADTPEVHQTIADIPTYVAKLKAERHHVTDVPLNLPSTAVTLQAHDGKVSTTDGPFMGKRASWRAYGH